LLVGSYFLVISYLFISSIVYVSQPQWLQYMNLNRGFELIVKNKLVVKINY